MSDKLTISGLHLPTLARRDTFFDRFKSPTEGRHSVHRPSIWSARSISETGRAQSILLFEPFKALRGGIKLVTAKLAPNITHTLPRACPAQRWHQNWDKRDTQETKGGRVALIAPIGTQWTSFLVQTHTHIHVKVLVVHNDGY